MLDVGTCVCISLVKYATLKAVAAAQSRPEKLCTRDLQRQLLKPDFRLLRILVDSFCDRSRLLPVTRLGGSRQTDCSEPCIMAFVARAPRTAAFGAPPTPQEVGCASSHPFLQPSLSANAFLVRLLLPGVAPDRAPFAY